MASTIMLNRNSSDDARALARSLAEKSGKQWSRLPFDEIVYWLHKAMTYVDKPNSACSC